MRGGVVTCKLDIHYYAALYQLKLLEKEVVNKTYEQIGGARIEKICNLFIVDL